MRVGRSTLKTALRWLQLSSRTRMSSIACDRYGRQGVSFWRCLLTPKMCHSFPTCLWRTEIDSSCHACHLRLALTERSTIKTLLCMIQAAVSEVIYSWLAELIG